MRPGSRGLAILLSGLVLLFAAAWLGLVWSPAHAAAAQQAAGNGASGTGRAEALLVAEVLLLLVVGRLVGEGMQRLGQPSLMGTLLAGIILGPSLFGWIWPQAQHFLFPKDETQKGMIDGLSQMGILMLLLLTGMDTDLRLGDHRHHLRNRGHRRQRVGPGRHRLVRADQDGGGRRPVLGFLLHRGPLAGFFPDPLGQ